MRSPSRTLLAILADLKAKQANAARRNKPTMWAYFLSMRRGLKRWFTARTDGGLAGQALALVQRAHQECSDAECPPTVAAHWWAMGTYAARILRAWDVRSPRRSLSWLRARAEEG